MSDRRMPPERLPARLPDLGLTVEEAEAAAYELEWQAGNKGLPGRRRWLCGKAAQKLRAQLRAQRHCSACGWGEDGRCEACRRDGVLEAA